MPEKWQGLGGGMGAVTLSFVVRGGPDGAEGAPAAVAGNGAPCAVAKACKNVELNFFKIKIKKGKDDSA